MKKHQTLKYSTLLILLGIGYYLSYRPVFLFKDSPLPEVATSIIGHKGCGSNHTPFSKLIENSKEGAVFGLKSLNGIELDIQMSASGSLYCFHGNNIEDCSGKVSFQIPDYSDKEINDYFTSCNNKIQLLDPILDIIASKPNSKISLDVKGFYFVGSLSYNGYLERIAEKISHICKSKGVSNQVLVESDSRAFHNKIKVLNSDIECYLAVYDWPNRSASFALSDNLDGLSLKNKSTIVSKETVDLYRKKGLKIQVWTVNDEQEITRIKELGVDYIQTDNVNYLINKTPNSSKER